MSVTTQDVEAMIATADVQARGGWRAPGSTLHVLIAGDERPLTTGALTMYLDFYAWLWGRVTPEDERERVRRRLEQVPVDAEWALRDRVRTVCLLWEQVQQRSPDDQGAIRALLRAPAPGFYPELDGSTDVATDFALSRTPEDILGDMRGTSAAQHQRAMEILQNRPKPPSWPPA